MKKKFFSLLLIFVMTVFSFSVLPVNAGDDYVAMINSVGYTSLDAAIASADAGQTVNIIASGTYELPDYINKNITISAVEGVIANCLKQGNYCYIPNGCNFNNITFNFGQFSYSGFQHAGKIKMTNCILNGFFNSYGEMEFNTCTFNAPGSAACPYVSGDKYSMWVYGDSILYENCNFNCAGKCINIYDEGLDNRSIVRFNNCTFASTEKNKAAINVKEVCEYDDYDVVLKYDVYIDENCKISSDSMDCFPTPEDSEDRLEVIDRLVQVDDKITSKHVTTADADAGVNVYWKGKKVYSTYPDPEPDPTPTPEPTPSEEYTIPVEGEGTLQAEADITNNNAVVKEITLQELEKITNPESGKETTTDTIKIDLSNAKQEVKSVELTKTSVENLADVTASKDNNISSVEIALTKASVTLDAKALDAITEQANGNTIQFVVDDTKGDNLNTAQQSALNDYDVNSTFEAYFESNGERIHDFKGGTAVVAVMFEPEQGRNVDSYKVYYVDESGKMTKYATKYVDGMLKFATTHFSDYAIVYDSNVDVLLLRAKTSGSKAVKLSWNGIDNASKYVVYGAKCGNNYKKLKTINGKSYTVKKISGKKLKAHEPYKFYVVAYDAVGNKVQSKSIHFLTANTRGKYANVKSIKTKVDILLLGIGRTHKIGTTYKMYAGKKHIKECHGSVLRYVSTNTEIAKVSSSGKVTAVGTGTATIYTIDIGGKYCKTKVTVE